MHTDRRDAIRVYSFGPAWGIPVPTPSPFGLKLLTWMRLHDVPYRLHIQSNPAKGPEGKCPWAVVSGEAIGDWDRFEALPRLGEYCERMRERCFPG